MSPEAPVGVIDVRRFTMTSRLHTAGKAVAFYPPNGALCGAEHELGNVHLVRHIVIASRYSSRIPGTDSETAPKTLC